MSAQASGEPMHMRRLSCLLCGCLLAHAGWLPGCAQPHSAPPVSSADASPAWFRGDEGPEESNIIRVNKFFSAEPWLTFSGDGTKQIDGLRFAVYLEGPRQRKGVFGTGTLVVTMFRLDRDPTGREIATQVYEWELPRDKAYQWRSKKATALGWGYGLRLQWGPEVEVAGRQIAIVVKYIREDGRIVYSSRKVLKVPSGKEQAITAASLAAPKPAAAPRKARRP